MDDRCDTLCLAHPICNIGLLPAEISVTQSSPSVGRFGSAFSMPTVPMQRSTASAEIPCCSRHWRGRPEGGPL